MKIQVAVLKATTFWTAALASLVLVMLGLVFTPPSLAVLLGVAVTGLLVTLAGGRLETPTVELLSGARVANEEEQQVLAIVVGGLHRVGINELELLVRRRQGHWTPAVTVLGRRSLVLSPGLVEAVRTGWVLAEEAVALVAQKVAAQRADSPHLELVRLVATSPWRVLNTVLRRVGAAFAWLPLVRTAWTLRGVVAVICVLQSVAEGRAIVGLLGAAVIAMTYLVPTVGRSLRVRTEVVGDQFVVDHGLGGVLARFLTRCGEPLPAERLHRLEHPLPQPAPRPLWETQVGPLTALSLN